MNKVILLGRLTSEPRINYSQGEKQMCIARFYLAVNRKTKTNNGQNEADFISCIAFDKTAEFVEKYLHQGTKVALVGHIQTGSYTRRDGSKVYTTDVVVEEMEFAESKSNSDNNTSGVNTHQDNLQYYQQKYQPNANSNQANSNDGFMNIPDGVEDDDLPFK
jgi:single-strand DNA-binding protein